MPKIPLRKQGNAFVPFTRGGALEADKIKPGAEVLADLRQRRNGKFHRLYWQFCTFVAEALNEGPGNISWTQEMVSDRLKIATGRADVIQLPRSMQAVYGAEIAVKPQSISFAKMDETEFGNFVEASMAYILTEFGPWVQEHPDWAHVREILHQSRMAA